FAMRMRPLHQSRSSYRAELPTQSWQRRVGVSNGRRKKQRADARPRDYNSKWAAAAATIPGTCRSLTMPSMRAVQVSHPGGPLELVERPIPDPGPGQVRVKVSACGICHSDSLTKDGVWPGIEYPRVPG